MYAKKYITHDNATQANTTQCTSPVSMVSQCKQMSRSDITKQRSALPYGRYGLGKTMFMLYMYGKTITVSLVQCTWPKQSHEQKFNKSLL